MNHYTEWSFVLDNVTPAQYDWFVEKEDNPLMIGCMDYDKQQLHFYNEGQSGDVTDLAELFRQFLNEFPEHKYVGFEYANYASRAAPDCFGGGAFFITKDDIEQLFTSDWLASKEEDYRFFVEKT